MKSVKIQLIISFTALWSLICTFIGQSFLAYNRFNDADSSYFTYGGLIINNENGLYKTFWDIKPPGIFYQNSLLINLFGINFNAFAWVHGVLFIICLAFLFLATSKHIGIQSSAFCTALVAYYFNLTDYLDFGNRPEFAMCLFEILSLSLILLYLKNSKLRYLVLAGSCSCMAFIFKPVGMASFLALLALSSIGLFSNNKSQAVKELFSSIFGFSLTISVILLSWMSLEPIRAGILMPLKLIEASNITIFSASLQTLWKYGPLWGFLPLLIATPYAIMINKQKVHNYKIFSFLLLFLFASLGGIIIQKRGSPHYFLQGIVPILILCSFSFHAIIQNSKFINYKKIIFIPIFIIIIFFSKFSFSKQIRNYNSLQQSYNIQKDKYTSLQHWLLANLDKKDHIYYWSHGYQPYILTQRKSPGLYSPYFLKFGNEGAKLISNDLDLVIKAKPKVVIELNDFQVDYFINGTNLKGLQKKCFNKYKNWVTSNYSNNVHLVPGFNIYIKN